MDKEAGSKVFLPRPLVYKEKKDRTSRVPGIFRN